jgi:long-chain fatty acid transport protein
MLLSRHPFLTATAVLALLAPLPLHATNGMNMEGYGPIAAAMGGASMAFDNGTAAVINNPATLGLLADRARLDLAVGVLGPKINVGSPRTAPNIFGVPANQDAESTAKAFFMPAFGYARRGGDFVYGFAVFGQGGMGCEYEPGTWRGLGFGLVNRTEVSVGRAIVPLSYKVNDQLQIAATIDFVWAGMDLKMAMSGGQFFDLVDPRGQQYGRASGGIVQGFMGMMQTLPPGTNVDYAYFNFSNGSDFTGAAKGYGYAGKIGFLYEVDKTLSFGGTYHSQTRLSDLKASGSAMSFQLNIPSMGRMPQTLAGDIRVRDFEWPATLGLGLAYRPDSKWLIAADIRQVYWSKVMKQFNMSFVASGAATNGPFARQNLDAILFQNWEDQTVVQLGAAYQLNKHLTLRFGGNWAGNPIPFKYVNCLFPATVERHLTAGLGWMLNAKSSLDASFTYGFKSEITNGTGTRVGHSQTNAQVMYSYRF